MGVSLDELLARLSENALLEIGPLSEELGFSTPARAFRAMLGEDAAALLDAYGVWDVALGDLELTPGLIERARAERGDAPLA